MKTKTLLLLLLISSVSATLMGQQDKKSDPLKYITSETKYVEEHPFKKKVFLFGITAQSDIFDDNSPALFLLKTGYDIRKFYEDYNVYWGVGPRLNFGWMTGNQVVHDFNEGAEFSFDSFAWGVSVAPSVGWIMDDGGTLGLYLEGEIGILNYHTATKLDLWENSPKKKNKEEYFKLNMAIRAGLRGNVSSKIEGSVWVGLSNVSTRNAIGKYRLVNTELEHFTLFGEVGIGFAF